VQDGFAAPVTIHLIMPVETAHGPVFTKLTTSFRGLSLDLPPAG
jgi:hypothetical protein